MIRDEILSFGKNIKAVKKVKSELDEINEELGLMMITNEYFMLRFLVPKKRIHNSVVFH